MFYVVHIRDCRKRKAPFWMLLHYFLFFFSFLKSLSPADILPGRNALVRRFYGILRYEPYLSGSLSSLDPAGVAIQTQQSRSHIPLFSRLGQCQITFQLFSPPKQKNIAGTVCNVLKSYFTNGNWLTLEYHVPL